MAKVKKRLTHSEEFEIMKLVLDKFLWLGVGVMAFGLFSILFIGLLPGIIITGLGAIILVLFLILILREYEKIK